MSKNLPDNVDYQRKDMFKVAFLGIKVAFKEEKNLQFDFIMAMMVTGCGFLFHVSKIEWLFLIFAMSQVIIAEMTNTVIENIVDFICPEYNLQAKKIKDLACGMVLSACIFSAIIGLLIFVPYILK